MIVIVLAPLSIGMLGERITSRPMFTPLGGNSTLGVREDRVRARGPFAHPSSAGIFTATTVPLMAPLWFSNPTAAVAGVLCATVATVSSNSSGPLMAFVFSIVGIGAWIFRRHRRALRWSLALGLVVLDFIMKAPVWYLMARVGSAIGGGGFHRAKLIDVAIMHIGEWWLTGTSYTADWLPYARTATEADITNQFIRYGIDGGLLTVVLFGLVIASAFKAVGIGLKKVENRDLATQLLVWSLGAALVSHVAAFFCTSYFDQVLIGWHFVLAASSAMMTPSFSFGDVLERGENLEEEEAITYDGALAMDRHVHEVSCA